VSSGKAHHLLSQQVSDAQAVHVANCVDKAPQVCWVWQCAHAARGGDVIHKRGLTAKHLKKAMNRITYNCLLRGQAAYGRKGARASAGRHVVIPLTGTYLDS
jgi:hypothetical protein